MKKQLLLSGLAVVAAALFLSSCEQEAPAPEERQAEVPEFRFTSNILQLERKSGDEFVAGDIIELKLTAPDGSVQINDSYVNEGGRWTAFGGTHYWYAGSDAGSILASSGFPEGSLAGSVKLTPESYPDPLRASLPSVKPTSEAVQLDFRHIYTRVQLGITSADPAESVQSVSVSGFGRAADYDLSTGAFSSLDGTGSVACESLGDGAYAFNFIPQNCALTFVAVTNKRTVTFSPDTEGLRNYEGGCSYTSILTLEEEQGGDDDDDDDDDDDKTPEFSLVTSVVDWIDGGELPSVITKIEKSQETVFVKSITLDPTSLSLSVGENRTISATVLPANAADKSLSWRSMNPSVATVSGGVVRAIAAGNSLIYATARDGSGISAICVVSVSEPEVKVSSITLSPSTLSLEAGSSQTITAVVLPDTATDKSVSWNSTNSSVATVNNGVVTAVAAGQSVVSATAQDGSGVSAQCVVTVSAAPVPTTEEVQVNLAQATIKTNAPMAYRTYWNGCDSNGMGGDCGWSNWFYEGGDRGPSDQAMKAGREANYHRTSNLYDGDASTSFHTNTDWAGTGDSTWGGGAPNAAVDFGSHFMQVTLPVSAKQLKIEVMNDKCPADSDHSSIIGEEGVNIYVRTGGSYVKLGTFQVSGAGTTATFDKIAYDGKFIDEIRFERNCEPGWTYCGNNFGFAEMKIWTIGETGTAAAASDVSNVAYEEPDSGLTPAGHTSVSVSRPSAPDGYSEVSLSSCQISTNNPMQYQVYGPYISEGYGNPVAITDQQKANRKDLFDKVANMWDSDAATSFHTNFDVWGLDWSIRSGAVKALNYIQINLPSSYTSFKIWICNPTNGYIMGQVGIGGDDPYHAFVDFLFSNNGQDWYNVSPYYEAAPYSPNSELGSQCLFDGYGVGMNTGAPANYVRIGPHVGETSSGTFNGQQGCFGIAELAIFAK